MNLLILQELRKMNIIYFDQWVYIRLLRAYKGKSPEYPKYAEICKGIIESSQKGINKFPFSLAHLEETIKRNNLDSRKELYKFIFDLSGFFTIRLWVQVINLEVRNAILKSLNLKPIDLSNYVFGNELGHCFGSKGRIKSNDPNKEIPEEIQNKLNSALKDSELMADLLCTDQMIDYVEQIIQRDKDLADRLEILRKNEYSHPDKNKRKDINDARFFLTVIQDEFIKALLEFNLDYKKYINHIFSSKESAKAFLKSIPTAYTFHVLNDARNQNFSRPIEPNDLWDLGTLAIAVPYCDVVVTEREWSNILNQKRIGELYSTKIIHRIEDLSEFI